MIAATSDMLLLLLPQTALAELVEEHEQMAGNPNQDYSKRFLKLRRTFFKVATASKPSTKRKALAELSTDVLGDIPARPESSQRARAGPSSGRRREQPRYLDGGESDPGL